jgi:hypothetical protein
MTFPSRWPAGTLAAAGTNPARTMNATATLALSQGHHPAKHRSAIPTRAYESGSGHGHDAAPAGHLHPPRPPPRPGNPGNPMPCPADCPGGRPPGIKGASGVAARALRAPGPRAPARVIWQRSRPRDQPGTPRTRQANPGKPSDHGTSQAQQQQKLDRPLHMSAQRTPDYAAGGS